MFFEALLALVQAGVLKRNVDGTLLHAAFFLGSRSFYRALREMSEVDLSRLQMTAVSFTTSFMAMRRGNAEQGPRPASSTMR